MPGCRATPSRVHFQQGKEAATLPQWLHFAPFHSEAKRSWFCFTEKSYLSYLRGQDTYELENSLRQESLLGWMESRVRMFESHLWSPNTANALGVSWGSI